VTHITKKSFTLFKHPLLSYQAWVQGHSEDALLMSAVLFQH